MRILFLGNNYNPISVACLQALVEGGFDVGLAGAWDPVRGSLVRTVRNSARTFGLGFVVRKGLELAKTRVRALLGRFGVVPSGVLTMEEVGRQSGVPLFRCRKLRSPEELEPIRRLGPDLIVVAAFSCILGKDLLRIPALGCINIHASLLPKYRGPNPFYWVLRNGERETGVTAHFIDEGIDTGDIVLQRVFPIESKDTEVTLRDKSAKVSAEVLVDVLRAIRNGTVSPRKQNEGEATYFSHPPVGASKL